MLHVDEKVIPAELLRTRFPVYALRDIPIPAPAVSLITHIGKEVIGPLGFMMTAYAAPGTAHDAN